MYTRVPHPEPSSLLPPRTIPLGRPSAPAPSNIIKLKNKINLKKKERKKKTIFYMGKKNRLMDFGEKKTYGYQR